MEAAHCLIGAIIVAGLIFLVSAIRVVPEERRLRVYRLGRYIGEKGPGLVLLIPMIDRAEDAEVTAATTNNGPLFGSIGETQDTVHSIGSVVVHGHT